MVHQTRLALSCPERTLSQLVKARAATNKRIRQNRYLRDTAYDTIIQISVLRISMKLLNMSINFSECCLNTMIIYCQPKNSFQKRHTHFFDGVDTPHMDTNKSLLVCNLTWGCKALQRFGRMREQCVFFSRRANWLPVNPRLEHGWPIVVHRFALLPPHLVKTGQRPPVPVVTVEQRTV